MAKKTKKHHRTMALVCHTVSRKTHGKKRLTKKDCLTKPRKYGKACGCKTKGGGFKFVKKSRCK